MALPFFHPRPVPAQCPRQKRQVLHVPVAAVVRVVCVRVQGPLPCRNDALAKLEPPTPRAWGESPRLGSARRVPALYAPD